MDGVAAAGLPSPPRLLGVLRTGVTDFLAHSWPLVLANLAWGALLLVVLATTSVTPLAWLLLTLLALPTVGVFRTAALIVRDEPVSVREGLAAWGRYGARAIVLGALLLVAAAVLGTNLVLGLEARGLVGWSLATFAGWGLAALATLAVVVWPLLVDPRREGLALREVLRLGALMALAHPLRFGGLALVLLGILALGTLAVVALLSVAIGFAAIVSCRFVLPAADRFAARYPASELSLRPPAPEPPQGRVTRGPR
jgi:uncharacterized membrane protein YesL